MLEIILFVLAVVYFGGAFLMGTEAGGKTTWGWGWPLRLLANWRAKS